MSGEYQTFIECLKSNKSFLDAIESKEVTLDFNLQIEIILLYLKTNYSIIEELGLKQLELLKDIIINDNYVIENDSLVYKGNIIPLSYFINIIKLVKNYVPKQLDNIIKFPGSKIVNIRNTPRKEGEIIDFVPRTGKQKSYNELSSIFNANLRVTEEIEQYIEETEDNFSDFMDTIIDGVIENNINELNKTSLHTLVGLLDVYALSYYHHHDSEFLNNIILPNAKINLTKCNFQNAEMKEYERKIEKLQMKMNNVDIREKALHYYKKLSDVRYRAFESQKEIIGNEIMALIAENYTVRNRPYIYNPHLIENLIKSITDKHVELNTKSANARLKFFNVEGDEAVFFATIHLSTLTNLIDIEDLIYYEYQPKKK